MSPIGSPRPSWLDWASMTERVAAELGHADAERDPGAGRGLVEDDGHGPRPVERPARVAVLLHGSGQVEHGELLGRAQVVVAQEVSQHGQPSVGVGASAGAAGATASRMPGRAARKASACPAPRTRAGASRIASGATALTMNPRSQGFRRHRRRHRRGQDEREQQALAAHGADGRMAERQCPVAQAGADGADVAEQVVPLDGVQDGQARGARDRVAAVRRARAGRRRAARRPRAFMAMAAPIGMPPPRPLATVMTSGPTPCRWWANQAPCGRCRSAPRRARAGCRGPR